MPLRFLRSYTIVAAALAGLLAGLLATPCIAHAQSPDQTSEGLIPGDYLRLSAGIAAPVNAQGSLRDWNSGVGANLFWENWQPGSGGMSRVGFGLGVGYSQLPLKESQLVADFSPPTGGPIVSATADKASILEITSMVRIRIPAPFIMPTVNIAFGYMNWAPGEIHYTSATTTGNAKQQHRSGAEFSIGGGLDKNIIDRYAIFGEA